MSSDSNTKKTGEERAVLEANERFYAASNDMFKGDLGLMKEVWSHTDDVTYMGPGGEIRVGWDQVLADWEQQAALKLGGEVSPEEITITLVSDLALVSNYVRGKNTNAGGKTEKVSIRASKVFRKRDGKWTLISLHVDPLPYL